MQAGSTVRTRQNRSTQLASSSSSSEQPKNRKELSPLACPIDKQNQALSQGMRQKGRLTAKLGIF